MKQVLSFVGEDGHPLVVDLASHYLVAISDVGLIKLWDISRRLGKCTHTHTHTHACVHTR